MRTEDNTVQFIDDVGLKHLSTESRAIGFRCRYHGGNVDCIRCLPRLASSEEAGYAGARSIDEGEACVPSPIASYFPRQASCSRLGTG